MTDVWPFDLPSPLMLLGSESRRLHDFEQYHTLRQTLQHMSTLSESFNFFAHVQQASNPNYTYVGNMLEE